VSINTGGALVDGKPYTNSAAVAVNIPSASGAGNTRIDRITLRADWTAQTVRIFRLAGVDAASPSAPALVQTSQTTWDLPLYQALVNTAGTVTLTDERVFGQVGADGLAALSVTNAKLASNAVTNDKMADNAVNTAELVDNAVTNAKLRDSSGVSVIGRSANSTGDPADIQAATDGHVLLRSGSNIGFGQIVKAGLADNAVDDEKVGDRVPQFYRRQGGHATAWSTIGTTTYTPGAVRMQGGAAQWTGALANSGSISITFPVAFSATVLAFVTMRLSSGSSNLRTDTICWVSSSSASVLNIDWKNNVAQCDTVEVNWLAIGPE
jgi:hypothetical protein